MHTKQRDKHVDLGFYAPFNDRPSQ